MPFRPKSWDDPSQLGNEIFELLVHPVTTPFTPLFILADYLGVSDYDEGESIRNTLVWGSLIGGAAVWNLAFHGRKYSLIANPRHLPVIFPRAAAALGYTALPVTLALGNKAVIERAPVHEQPSLWRGFSQGLTGTGPGVGGYIPS